MSANYEVSISKQAAAAAHWGKTFRIFFWVSVAFFLFSTLFCLSWPVIEKQWETREEWWNFGNLYHAPLCFSAQKFSSRKLHDDAQYDSQNKSIFIPIVWFDVCCCVGFSSILFPFVQHVDPILRHSNDWKGTIDVCMEFEWGSNRTDVWNGQMVVILSSLCLPNIAIQKDYEEKKHYSYCSLGWMQGFTTKHFQQRIWILI